jgi:hypothetical protein
MGRMNRPMTVESKAQNMSAVIGRLDRPIPIGKARRFPTDAVIRSWVPLRTPTEIIGDYLWM